MNIAEQTGIIRYHEIEKSGFVAAGVVAVISCKTDSGINVLLVQHRGYDSDKVEEGQWGLPSETLRWLLGENSKGRARIKAVEPLFSALIRCGQEEMGIDFTRFNFTVYPEKFAFQWPFQLNDSLTAYSRVIFLWLDPDGYDDLSSNLGEVETEETRAVEFIPLSQIVGEGTDLRNNTKEILTWALENGFFGGDRGPGTGKSLTLNRIPQTSLSRDFRLV